MEPFSDPLAPSAQGVRRLELGIDSAITNKWTRWTLLRSSLEQVGVHHPRRQRREPGTAHTWRSVSPYGISRFRHERSLRRMQHRRQQRELTDEPCWNARPKIAGCLARGARLSIAARALRSAPRLPLHRDDSPAPLDAHAAINAPPPAVTRAHTCTAAASPGRRPSACCRVTAVKQLAPPLLSCTRGGCSAGRRRRPPS